MKLSHVLSAVYDSPWAIRPRVLRAIDEVVREHAFGPLPSHEEVQTRLEVAAAAAGPRRGGRVVGAIGIIPIYGVIMPRATLMSEFSGGTSVSGITAAFRAALDDDAVGQILLDVDSPGGQVEGITELAAEIRAARGQKPITAIANYGMASAAYWIACQADEIVASPSALVGSIGCFIVHAEYSKALEEEGAKVTIIRQPANKADANTAEPLSDVARANLEERVSDYYAQFVGDVAKGRGVSTAAVRGGYGDGHVLLASRAKAAGLVDRVETFTDTLRRLSGATRPGARGPSASAGDALRAQLEEEEAAELAVVSKAVAAIAADVAATAGEPDAGPEIPDPEPETPADDEALRAQAALELARAQRAKT